MRRFLSILIALTLAFASTMHAAKIAYVYYSSDSVLALAYKALLDSSGYSTSLIEINQVMSTNFSLYDAIIIGDRTVFFPSWGDSATAVEINNSNKPIIGVGQLGYAYFGMLSLRIGNPNGWEGSTRGSIVAMDPQHPIYNILHYIQMPSDSVLQLCSSASNEVGIYLPSMRADIIPLGRELGDLSHYPLVQEDTRYFLWGFSSPPSDMTQTGKDLFCNIVAFMIQATPPYYARLTHVSGNSTGSFAILISDSSKVKSHLYVITGVDSVGLTGAIGYTLKDSTTNTVLLMNNPLPDPLGRTSPIIDGFKVLFGTIDTLYGMANWMVGGTRHWTWANANGLGLEGFNGAIGMGSDWFSTWGAGKSTVASNKLRDVEIRFANTDASGNILNSSDPNVSFAYRYLRHAGSPPAQPLFASFIVNPGAGYAFQDYKKSMPMAAYDINVSPPRRLMVGFLENNVTNGLVDGKYWPPYFDDPIYGDNIASPGPREWFFLFDDPYGTTPDTALETDIFDNNTPMMWFGSVDREDTLGWSSTETFRIIAHHPLSSADKWTFNPSIMSLNGMRVKLLPHSFQLYQNYPNPFNPSTIINYQLPTNSHVTLKVYDILGREVVTLVDRSESAGYRSVKFNASSLSSGVYFYRLQAGQFTAVRRLMIIK